MRLHITTQPPLQPRVSVTVRFQFRQAPILFHPTGEIEIRRKHTRLST